MTLEEYLDCAKVGLTKTSRTANGIVDLSTSKTKVDSMETVEADHAKELAYQNYEKAIIFAYEHKNDVFSSIEDVKNFILEIGKIICRGMVKEGMLIRNGEDTDKYKYVRIADISDSFDLFASHLLEKLNEEPYNPIYTAAMMEFYLNMKIHLFSDGCGKSSKVASAFALMRKDMPLPNYRSNAEYFSHEPSICGDLFQEQDQKDFQDFYQFYQTLFTEN